MFIWCWSSVYDAGPASYKHWVIVWCCQGPSGSVFYITWGGREPSRSSLWWIGIHSDPEASGVFVVLTCNRFLPNLPLEISSWSMPSLLISWQFHVFGHVYSLIWPCDLECQGQGHRFCWECPYWPDKYQFQLMNIPNKHTFYIVLNQGQELRSLLFEVRDINMFSYF